jgi:hypothetical protein
MFSEALGRVINVVQPANNVYVKLTDYAGVTFIGFEAATASSVTITFAADAAGTGAVTPAVVDHYYGATNATSGGVWHRTAVAPASNTFNKSNSGEDRVAVYVSAASCPDGKPYVKCTLNGSGVTTAILHDPAYGRAPQNLRSVTA